MQYVAGLLFSRDGSRVALIQKRKPEWQAGLFNAIGGKMEVGESASQAMRRECIEETGVDVDWHFFTTIRGQDFECHFYHCFDDRMYDVRTVESESVVHVDVHSIPLNVIPNIRWLIPLALDVNTTAPPSFFHGIFAK